MYQQLVKELRDFELEHREYSKGEVRKMNLKDNMNATAAWVAAKVLLNYLENPQTLKGVLKHWQGGFFENEQGQNHTDD